MDEEVDVAALLASINANFDPEEQPQEVNEPQHQSEEIHNEQAQPIQESIIIIRSEATPVQEVDPMMEIVQRIEIQNSLLTNKDIQDSFLDTSAIQELIQSINDVYDIKLDSINKKQKQIFSHMIDIRNKTTHLVNQQTAKDNCLSKMKSSEIINKQKEIDMLEIQTNKTKGYILSIIERLDIIETRLDKMIDIHVKKKVQELQL